MQKKFYGESTIAESKVYQWNQHFKEGRESIDDEELVGRPSTSRTAENVAFLYECVRKGRRQTLALFNEATHWYILHYNAPPHRFRLLK